MCSDGGPGSGCLAGACLRWHAMAAGRPRGLPSGRDVRPVLPSGSLPPREDGVPGAPTPTESRQKAHREQAGPRPTAHLHYSCLPQRLANWALKIPHPKKSDRRPTAKQLDNVSKFKGAPRVAPSGRRGGGGQPPATGAAALAPSMPPMPRASLLLQSQRTRRPCRSSSPPSSS